jgi:hypothetical protein
MWKKLGRTSATALAVFTLSASLTALAPPAGATTGPVLGAAGTSLTINGVASQLTGVDAYELADSVGYQRRMRRHVERHAALNLLLLTADRHSRAH